MDNGESITRVERVRILRPKFDPSLPLAEAVGRLLQDGVPTPSFYASKQVTLPEHGYDKEIHDVQQLLGRKALRDWRVHRVVIEAKHHQGNFIGVAMHSYLEAQQAFDDIISQFASMTSESLVQGNHLITLIPADQLGLKQGQAADVMDELYTRLGHPSSAHKYTVAFKGLTQDTRIRRYVIQQSGQDDLPA